MRGLLTTVLLLAVALSASGQRDKVYTSLSEVQEPDSVYILRLNHKRLREIPPIIFTFSNLHTLDLGKNRINNLPPEIGTLKNLQELDLRRNKLRTVPPEVGQLTQLQHINLSRNPILDLPEEMGALVNLKELIIWCTGIVDFPESFKALNYSLQLIDMRVCPMTWDNQQAVEELLPTPKKRWDHVCNCK